MNGRTPIFAANWKMNKLVRESAEFVEKFTSAMVDCPLKAGKDFEVLLAPSPTHLSTLAGLLKNTPFKLSAQNSGTTQFGAFTGETSPAVLKELGCDWVILGHSERRHVFKEDDALIMSRVHAALTEGLNVLLCVGEVLADRKAGNTFKTIETQLSKLKESLPPGSISRLSLAYEPVWAIGTGEVATPEQAQEVHLFIRKWLAEKCNFEESTKIRILYGGSVKPDNSAQIMAQKDVDGLLVGGASLDPATFAGVIKSGLKSRV